MAAILIVEDDAELAEVIALLLKDAGHHVTTACCFDDALGAVMRSPPQIVLADWNVPGGTALDLRDALESHGLGHVPLVAMTGMTVAPERLAEFAAVLPKPFPATELVDLVHGLLGPADPARA